MTLGSNFQSKLDLSLCNKQKSLGKATECYAHYEFLDRDYQMTTSEFKEKARSCSLMIEKVAWNQSNNFELFKYLGTRLLGNPAIYVMGLKKDMDTFGMKLDKKAQR